MKRNKFFDKVEIENGKIKYFGKGGGNNIPINLESKIPPSEQSSNAFTAMPPGDYNGGLYANGAQFNGPWGNIPGPATTDYQINNRLISANPPKDALVQYPGTAHLGNNYQAMNGINWYNNTSGENPGPFQIQCPNCQVGGKRKKSKNKKGGSKNYPINLLSQIPAQLQNKNAFTLMPSPDFNGGLYANGAQFNGSWGNIPVPPTVQGMTNNLKSAQPPPGAELQMPGTARLGNNYQAMKGVNWFNDTSEINQGPFQIQCTKGGKKSKKKKSKKKKKQKGGNKREEYVIQTTAGATPESNASIQKLTQLGADNLEQTRYDNTESSDTLVEQNAEIQKGSLKWPPANP